MDRDVAGSILIIIGVLLILDGVLSLISPMVGHFPTSDWGRILRVGLGIVIIWVGRWMKQS